MAGASDKARFYLEQSIPELKEYQRKKIFSEDEITSIAQKRSYFEHILNARGSNPSGYARYAEYEINVDLLRRKRVKRLSIKAPMHSGQRRIFFILDRATRKFPGDIGLWMQSIEYARKQKAHKKLSQILTKVLRLHPTKPDLWIYAAQFAFDEHADMTEGRSYMQRGLRFCKSSKNLWLDYAKLEILYIAKIATRQQILGLGAKPKGPTSPDLQDDASADVIHLPKLSAEDVNPSLDKPDDVDESALRTLDSTPVMTGAIPIAIFEAAMNQFENDDSLGKAFFDLVSEFEQIPCLRRILDHVVQTMMKSPVLSVKAHFCNIKVAVAGIKATSPDFPKALGLSLSRLKQVQSQGWLNSCLAQEMTDWLHGFLQNQSLDSALEKVISARIRVLREVLEDQPDR